MVNKHKEEIDWCCEELKRMTAVRPHNGGRTWDWPPHIAEVGWGKARLVWIQHEPNETITNTLDTDEFGDEMDYTFQYCPFCGSETNPLTVISNE